MQRWKGNGSSSLDDTAIGFRNCNVDNYLLITHVNYLTGKGGRLKRWRM
jgi:hypothetical protein